MELGKVVIHPNGIMVEQPGINAWYPLVGLGHIPQAMRDEMERRVNAGEPSSVSNIRVKKQYRYACACGCEGILETFSGRKARRAGFANSIAEIFVVFEGGLVLADAFSLADAERIATAFRGQA